jgi:hypothetical protein
MTDNRTTELLCKLLEECGIEWKDGDAAYEIEWSTPDGRHCSAMYWKPTFSVLISGCTPEQAIAATLGSEHHAYEQRITGDGSDWGEIMRNAYDDLMATACESCTPEQMEQLADYIRSELGGGACGVEVIQKTRKAINALRAHYGAGPTTMTDEQIAEGLEVYGAKKDVGMMVIDDPQLSTMRKEGKINEMVSYL